MEIKYKSQSWHLPAGLSSGGCLVKRAVAQSGSSCGWSCPVQPSAAWFCSHQQRFTRRLSQPVTLGMGGYILYQICPVWSSLFIKFLSEKQIWSKYICKKEKATGCCCFSFLHVVVFLVCCTTAFHHICTEKMNLRVIHAYIHIWLWKIW